MTDEIKVFKDLELQAQGIYDSKNNSAISLKKWTFNWVIPGLTIKQTA